ncbi:MAG: DUF3280 domain-containing protein [Vicinamibacterales bacterium]
MTADVLRPGSDVNGGCRRAMAMLVTILAILLLPGPNDAQEAPRRVAVFDVELWDTSGEGERPEQAARLAMLGDVLRTRLAESSGYVLVDLARVRPEIAASLRLFRRGGCQLELARKAGARYALNVFVRKMSTLIQEIALILADVERDEVVAFYSVSIRNNSDDAWRRGLLFLLEHRLPESDAF